MMIPKIFPVTSNSQRVGPGSTFVAIKGSKHNGASFIAEAISRGATTIVVEQSACTEEILKRCSEHNVSVDIVTSARKELAYRTTQALENPAQQLNLVGITGTKGKTTSTFLIDHILRWTGLGTGLVGSIKNKIAAKKTRYPSQETWEVIETPARLTTPESDEIQMFLAQCVKEGVDHVVIEVSSHALSLDRVQGLEFDAVGFLNLHHDHMDFYQNMDSYFQAKMHLFEQVKADGTIVINLDDAWGTRALEYAQKKHLGSIITIGQQSHTHKENNVQHVRFLVTERENLEFCITTDEQEKITCPTLLGTFNAYNVMLAKIICHHLGIAHHDINAALERFPGVPGRMQLHRLQNGALGIIDYAHNALSTESVLKFLRSKTKNLIVVCGAGGDRDPSRRPQIAQIAAEYADQIILTVGNPRTENPSNIIDHFFSAIPIEKRTHVTREENRQKAINHAINASTSESIIAVLGQGHEPYHLVGDDKTFFTDYEILCRH